MASVLETFMILFDSDASKAKEDTDKLDSSLSKTEKTSSKTIGTSDKLGKEFVAMGKSALSAVTGVFALASILSGMASQTQTLQALSNTSKALNVNIGDLDAWGKAVEKQGGSASSFQSSIASLNDQLIETSIKGTSAVVPYFNALGISMLDANGEARSTMEILPEIADAFEGLSGQQQIAFGKKLGLDQETIILLQQGRREVEALVGKQKELGVATEEAAELSKEFNAKMNDMKQVFSFMSQSVLVEVLPAITWLLDGFKGIGEWVSENQPLVRGLFIGIGLAILKFALPPLIALISPFLLLGLVIGGLIAIFGFLYDELYHFFTGGDSLIGEAVKKWPILGTILCGLKDVVMTLIEVWKEWAMFLVDVFTNPMAALEKLKNLASSVGKAIGRFFGFGKGKSESDYEEDIDEIEESVDMEAARNVEHGKAALNAAGGSAIGAQSAASVAGSSSSNKSTSLVMGDTIINTQATDADGIASDAAGSLDRQLRSTLENYDDGVLM